MITHTNTDHVSSTDASEEAIASQGNYVLELGITDSHQYVTF